MMRIAVVLVAAIAVPLVLMNYPVMAQIPDPVMAAQAPIPGSDHNYIGVATETVNPADGSLTFDLPLPLPPGRQLSLPFSIHYDSGLTYYLSPYKNGSISTFPDLNWVPTPQSSLGSLSLPFLSFQGVITQAVCHATGQGQTTTCYQCNGTTSFVFQGLNGIQYPLGQIGAGWSNSDYAPGGTTDPNCPYRPPSGGTFHGILVTPGTQDPTLVYGQPSMALTDSSGTVYQFPATPIGQISSFAPFNSPYVLYPQTITDRNGNQLTLTSDGYKDTLGRTVISWSSGQSGTTIAISGFGNVSITGTMSASPMTFPGSITDTGHTNQPCVKNATQPYATTYVQTQIITLPNKKTYKLTFDSSFGQIDRIDFPGGGYVSYVWGTNANSSSGNASYTFTNNNVVNVLSCTYQFDTPAISDRYVSYDGTHQVLHQHFSYSTSWNPAPLETWIKTTTVTTTDLVTGQSSTTVYTYGPIQADTYNSSSWLSASAPVERQIQYKDGNGNVLETVNKTWGDVRHVIGEQTVLSNGQGSAKQYCYDSNEQLTDVYEYGFQSEGAKPGDPSCYTSAFQSFGSGVQGDPGLNNGAIGPLDRHTKTVLHNFVGATPSTHIVNAPDSVTVYDGSNNQVSQSSFGYDQSELLSSSVATQTGLVSPPGLRGNTTSVTHWSNIGTSPSITYIYYETGQMASMKDSRGNTTTFVYTDNPPSGNVAGNSNAFITQITKPSTGITSHIDNYSYNYSTSQLVEADDENSQPTKYKYGTEPSGCSYADQLNRLGEIDYPDAGETTYCYNDSVPSITTAQRINSTATKTTGTTMDGMDHVMQTLISDPNLSGDDSVETQYDGLGHVYTVTNPHRGSTSSPTNGTTTYTYDALGRKILQQQPDGNILQWCYNGLASNSSQSNCMSNKSSKAGSWVDYSDETGRHWQRVSDGLGRLVAVMEPDGSTTVPNTSFLETDYQYDALNNLLNVNQHGVTRSFTYDSLSRLITAYNPESGWICYGTWSGSIGSSTCQSGYDANGNLLAKTDARGVVTSYAYDALNRLTWKSFNDGKTAMSCYQYDTSSLASSNANLVGRLTNEWTQSPSVSSTCATSLPSSGYLTRRSILSYDAMGRVTSEQQCTPSNCTSATPYALTYQYDLAGNVDQYTNGTGSIMLTPSYDAANRLSQITSSWQDTTHPSPVFSSPTYYPGGQLQGVTYGSGLTLSRTYDNRLRITGELDNGKVVPQPTAGSATITITGAEQSH